MSPAELTVGMGERRWGRSQIIRRAESIVLHKSFDTLCSTPYTPYSEAIAKRFTLHLESLSHRENRLRERLGVAIISVLQEGWGLGGVDFNDYKQT